jgi:hypothetical protein
VQRFGGATKQLFLKTRDGKYYAFLFVEIGATSDLPPPNDISPEAQKKFNPPGSIQIRCILNPTGSRSLEPDPKKIYKSYDEYLKAEQREKQKKNAEHHTEK